LLLINGVFLAGDVQQVADQKQQLAQQQQAALPPKQQQQQPQEPQQQEPQQQQTMASRQQQQQQPPGYDPKAAAGFMSPPGEKPLWCVYACCVHLTHAFHCSINLHFEHAVVVGQG
jgi:hemolysin activation/secretion protein